MLGLRLGDEVRVDSQAYSCGSQSVAVLHRVTPTAGSDCLYVENLNRWITRARSDGGSGLAGAAPLGFTHDHLPRLPADRSLRAVPSAARRAGTLLSPAPAASHLAAPPFTTTYRIDPARDLNAVGIVYFASYFAIIDSAVLAFWRHLGRPDHAFLRRRVLDQKLCYLENAAPHAELDLTLRLYTLPDEDVLDITLRDRTSGRLLALSTLDIAHDDPDW